MNSYNYYFACLFVNIDNPLDQYLPFQGVNETKLEIN